MKKINKCPMCDQHQFIEAGTVGDEPFYITIEEFVDINLKSWPAIEAKAELFQDLIDCIDNLINSKAHMPSVRALLREAKSLK